eukprot:COSAG04_NODE_1789_length_5578_cov_9.159153_4_plen_90_part_00
MPVGRPPASQPRGSIATAIVDGRQRITGTLWLAGSGVHGPVAALRALPGLGAGFYELLIAAPDSLARELTGSEPEPEPASRLGLRLGLS